MVAIDGSIESPRSPPSIRMVGRQSGGQQRRQNGRPAGAIESASRFYGASEIAAKAIVLINLIALTCQTISLDHIRIDPGLGGAIAIVHGDREGRRHGRSRWLRRAA